MKSFTVHDLQVRTGELIRCAEAGKLSVVTKNGAPVFVAVPFDDTLLERGVRSSLAIKLFNDGSLTLAQAAKVAGFGIEEMIERTGTAGVAVVQQTPEELDHELAVIACCRRSR